jgi:hypothetical protein
MNGTKRENSKKRLTRNEDTYILMSAIHKGQIA